MDRFSSSVIIYQSFSDKSSLKSIVVGHGDIARAIADGHLNDRPGLLYFASGVSNSHETRESEYEREKKLLLSQPRNFKLVYFSSLCIFYSDTRYAKHKLEMEELVRNNFPKYTIMRVGNITWGKNPRLLINNLKNRVRSGESYTDLLRYKYEGYRYIVNKNEFTHWVSQIPDWNCEMNITGRKMTFEEVFQKYANPYRQKNGQDIIQS